MTIPSKLAEHVLQAAFRYLEKRNVDALLAASWHCPEIVKMRSEGRGLIHAAAKSGDVDLLAALLNSGADPDMREGEWSNYEETFIPGYVALQHAARGGHLAAVELLLFFGANPKAADYDGGTPLHAAVAAEHAGIAEALLTGGAEPNAECGVRHFNEETLGWYYIATPLHNVGNKNALIQTLVKHGAKVEAGEPMTGRTPLHFAAARGLLEAVNALLDLGANPNAIAETHNYSIHARMSPLHYAAEHGYADVVESLIRAGANPNSIADYVQEPDLTYQLVPLHYAAQNGHENVVRSLLRLGAYRSVRGGPEKKTAAEMALAAGHKKVALILKRSPVL